jgi:hypothetical protein
MDQKLSLLPPPPSPEYRPSLFASVPITTSPPTIKELNSSQKKLNGKMFNYNISETDKASKTRKVSASFIPPFAMENHDHLLNNNSYFLSTIINRGEEGSNQILRHLNGFKVNTMFPIYIIINLHSFPVSSLNAIKTVPPIYSPNSLCFIRQIPYGSEAQTIDGYIKGPLHLLESLNSEAFIHSENPNKYLDQISEIYNLHGKPFKYECLNRTSTYINRFFKGDNKFGIDLDEDDDFFVSKNPEKKYVTDARGTTPYGVKLLYVPFLHTNYVSTIFNCDVTITLNIEFLINAVIDPKFDNSYVNRGASVIFVDMSCGTFTSDMQPVGPAKFSVSPFHGKESRKRNFEKAFGKNKSRKKQNKKKYKRS